MILVDTNLLLYAKVAGLPNHALAAKWLEQAFASPSRVGLPWPSLLGFLRISTNARAFARPLAMAQAWEQVEEWRLRLHSELDRMLETTRLPEHPDYERANDFLLRARRYAASLEYGK